MVAGITAGDGQRDLEIIFRTRYDRVARIIGGVIRDPARAEELAVEVFLKWERHGAAREDQPDGWLYRTAVRMGLNELRRQARRERYERLLAFARPPTPEEVRAVTEEQERVRAVLRSLRSRQAELLLLRSQGMSYAELAAALQLNAASVGVLLSRAQEAFRKEYVNRYGA